MTLVLFETLTPQIGKITLNDPENLNAMGESMAEEFSNLIEKIKADKQNSRLRAIILTGSGRAFSAGGDLQMLKKKTELSQEENRLRMLKFYNSFLGMLSLKIPLIAAINGHAIGAGLCVACACDIRVAGDKAKLGFTFVKLGLHPGMGATYFLPRVIGAATATELMLTGRVIDAETAVNIGLVNRLVPNDDVVAAAQKIAQEVAESGPESVRQLLESLRSGPASLHDSLEREAHCQGLNYASNEFKEGVQAAIDKRPAKF